MQLTKVQHGLLEEDNFYITSRASDFLGDGRWSRTENIFKLKNGTIKRKFPHKNGFLIEVQKEVNGIDFEFFFEDSKSKIGIKEVAGDEKISHWRIIYYNNFIQTYSSTDGVTWINKGGSYYIFEGDILQGFSVNDDELILTDYKVYSSPYLTIQNAKPNTIAQLYNIDGVCLSEKLFNEDYECNIFLENNLEGYIKILSDEEYTSSIFYFKQGDVFLFTENNLKLIYNGSALSFETTTLNSYTETFKLVNLGDNKVSDIHIEIINNNSDNIELSLNKQHYSNLLYINSLSPYEELIFYLKITKSNTVNFRKKDFEINIY